MYFCSTKCKFTCNLKFTIFAWYSRSYGVLKATHTKPRSILGLTHREQSSFCFFDEGASSAGGFVGAGLEDKPAAGVVDAVVSSLGGVRVGQRGLRTAVVAVPAAVVRRQPERRRRAHAIPVPQPSHPLSLVRS